MGRDAYFGETPGPIHSYTDLVVYLNKLNGDWIKAAKRLTPQVLTKLLAITGKQYCEHIAKQSPFDKAPVTAWKLFSKGISIEEAKQTTVISGDIELGEVALNMVSVMA